MKKIGIQYLRDNEELIIKAYNEDKLSGLKIKQMLEKLGLDVNYGTLRLFLKEIESKLIKKKVFGIRQIREYEDLVIRFYNVEGLTLKQIQSKFKEMGFDVGYNTIKVYIREIKDKLVERETITEQVLKFKDEILELKNQGILEKDIIKILNKKYNTDFFNRSCMDMFKSIIKVKTEREKQNEWLEENKEWVVKLRVEEVKTLREILPILNKKAPIKIKEGALWDFYIKENSLNSETVKKKGKEKAKETNLKIRGVDNPMKDEKIKQKAIETNLKRRGVKYSFESEEVKEKIKQTNLERTGVTSQTQKHYSIKARKILFNQRQFLAYCLDLAIELKEKPSIAYIAKDLDVSFTNITKYIKKYNAEYYVSKNTSIAEVKILNLLNKLNVKIELHNRVILAPKEIDIYLPEYKIGIEINPTYTHNSTKGTHWGNKPKTKDYHYKKYKKAREAGIFLIQLYDWDLEDTEKLEEYFKNIVEGSKEIPIQKELIIDLNKQNIEDYLQIGYKEDEWIEQVIEVIDRVKVKIYTAGLQKLIM